MLKKMCNQFVERSSSRTICHSREGGNPVLSPVGRVCLQTRRLWRNINARIGGFEDGPALHGKNNLSRHSGFTLVELVVVIVILGIVASVATRKMTSTIDNSRYDATLREMEHLARAIRGNPESWSEGARADFGYVGDIGAFPPNLDALVTNPGLATWAGPYIEQGSASDDFKKDGWGTAYTIIGTTIRSTGSGSNIDKEVVSAVSWLTANSLTGSIVDANNNMPGSVYKDSLRVIVSYPNGSGGTATASIVPSAKGNFTVAGLPIGNRQLRVVWIPDNDTMSWSMAIYPNKPAHLSVVFPSDLF